MTTFFAESVHDYENDVKNSGNSICTFVKFSASWCSPCNKIQPTIDKWCEENHYDFFIVDIDCHEEITESENITSIPFFICYSKGVKIDSFQGSDDNSVLNFLNSCVNNVSGEENW
tara:strand:+ start:6106 stop:6453 length:348 start_codon:yes stop_codon:yes gene_type:complete